MIKEDAVSTKAYIRKIASARKLLSNLLKKNVLKYLQVYFVAQRKQQKKIVRKIPSVTQDILETFDSFKEIRHGIVRSD